MTTGDFSKIAVQMRKDILAMGLAAGNHGAHLGGALSLVEILIALYMDVMCFDAKNPCAPQRDRLILSKGHGVMAQYAALKYMGLLTEQDITHFKKDGTKLFAHPSMNADIGIEFSSGSLGQGLSLGVGTALALKHKKQETPRVYVILGDGECNEGSVWEAAMSAAHFKLHNLVAIIDCNALQYDGPTETIQSLGNLAEKWTAFGWHAIEVKGHDTQKIITALRNTQEKPLVVIAHTVKGQGISFMEHQAQWHNGVLNPKLYETAMAELEQA